MKIIRANHLGMCFGVRDAIDLAVRTAGERPLTIMGQLVHNPVVLKTLSDHGVRMADHPSGVSTDTVMITAHGASERSIEALRNRGLDVIEATCPLVHFAHRAVRNLVAEGYHPVVIGQRNHVEVRGLTGDLDEFDIVENEADVETLPGHPRLGVASQTTQPVDKVAGLVGAIRRRFPHSDIRFIDTVCHPTKQRQAAAIEMACRSDLVIVVGGANSNNTLELLRTCRRHCDRVHHVQDASGIAAEWFADASVVGITAGTSTPDRTIDAVEERIRRIDHEQEKGPGWRMEPIRSGAVNTCA